VQGGIVSASAGYLRLVPSRNPYPTAAPFLPDRLSMSALREAVQGCRGCPLYANATQAVFGEGRLTAEVMLVGEQPGDQEDLAGAPFVGPAGKLLDQALEEAAINRGTTYVTNAVKHFKWKARGTRRIHDKPTWTEAMACRPWLDAELALVKPRALVLMGATAAQALLGKSFKVTRERGRPLDSELADLVIATIHPSAVLRAENRDEMFAELVDDLRVVSRTFAH
jgi:uracil-DNA glycosylase family protein